MAPRSRQIAINAASQWGVTIIGCVLGLLLVPFLIGKLGRDGYGLIAVIMAIVGACALADLGISGALGRHLAESLAKGDEREFSEFVSTAAGINLLVGLATAAAVLVFAQPLARLFAIPESLFSTGVFLLRSYGAAYVLLTLLMPVPRAVLASHDRFDLASQLDAIRQLIQSASFFAVLGLTDSGLAGWAIVSVLVGGLCTILLWGAAFRLHKGLRLSVSRFRTGRLKELYGLGSRFTLLAISSQLSNNADPFILTTRLGPGSLSFYRPPSQVLGLFAPVVLTLGSQLHPLATTAYVQQNKRDMTKILFRGTKYTMSMGAVFCGIVVSLAYPLCKVWLGKVLGEQYTICAAVLTIQVGTYLGAFAAGTQWPVLLGMTRTAFAAYGRLAFAVVNIVASCLLVWYTPLGVLGVVIPTMVIELIWRPMLIHHVCRALDVSVRAYLREAYLSPLLVGAAVAAMGFAIRWLAPPENLWSLIASATALALTGAALIWFAAFSRSDRVDIQSVIRSLVMQRCASES